jgi:hypothetical protein
MCPWVLLRAVLFLSDVQKGNTRRCCPGLIDDLLLKAILYTAGGVGELYLRRSTFILSFRCVEQPPPHQDWGRAFKSCGISYYLRVQSELRGEKLNRHDLPPSRLVGAGGLNRGGAIRLGAIF